MGAQIFWGGVIFDFDPFLYPLAQNFQGSFQGPLNVAKCCWNWVENYFRSRVIAVWIFRKLPLWGRISRQPLTLISKLLQQSIELRQL